MTLQRLAQIPALMIETEGEYCPRREEKREELRMLQAYIEAVGDPYVRNLLVLRCVRRKQWREVAAAVHSTPAATEIMARRYVKAHPAPDEEKSTGEG